MELNMYKLAEQLKQLREAKKDAEQRVKDINAEIDKTEYSLVQLMAETETQNFTRAGTMVLADNQNPCIRCGRS